MPLAPLDPLLALDDSTLASLTAVFRERGFTPDAFALTERTQPGQLPGVRDPFVRRVLDRTPGPVATLLGLFVYGYETPRDAVRDALGEPLMTVLRDVLVLPGTQAHLVRSPFQVQPIGEQWFVSDPLEGGTLAVMGPGATTLILHEYAARFAAARALDLGCGAASLAIAAAARGARATATDVNARALTLAAFNARLNRVPLDVRASDVGAALRGETYDLVLGQPPYLADPHAAPVTFLHGGAYGDEIAWRFVHDAARLLAPGGTALLLFDYPQRTGTRLAERIAAAIGDAHAGYAAISRPGASLDQAAAHVAAVGHPSLGAEWEREARAYRDHYDALGITAFTNVLLVVQRPGADGAVLPRIVVEHHGRKPPEPGVLADWLAGIHAAARPDDALLECVLAPLPGAVFAGVWTHPAHESPASLRVEFPEGAFATNRELGDRGWLLFGLLDGTRTLREAVAPFAEACDVAPAAAEVDVLGFAREGLARGMLQVRR
ncbi:MAG: methyltransferase [Candidatus Eisenbacteria bacterium]